MKKRSIVLLVVLCIVTFGIYPLFWLVSTKNEMNQYGAGIPTAWLLIVPIVSMYWIWKYCEGVQKVTRNELSGPVAFLLLLLISVVGMAVIQSKFNEMPAQIPQARVAA